MSGHNDMPVWNEEPFIPKYLLFLDKLDGRVGAKVEQIDVIIQPREGSQTEWLDCWNDNGDEPFELDELGDTAEYWFAPYHPPYLPLRIAIHKSCPMPNAVVAILDAYTEFYELKEQ